MGSIVNKSELSKIIGISERSLTDWQEAGMPVNYRGARGESNEYDTELVIRWMIDRELEKVQGESQRDRLARLQADMVEIDLLERMGKIAPVEAYEQEWASLMIALRKNTFNELPRIARMCDAVSGYASKLDILNQTFTELYTKLSMCELEDPP